MAFSTPFILEMEKFSLGFSPTRAKHAAKSKESTNLLKLITKNVILLLVLMSLFASNDDNGVSKIFVRCPPNSPNGLQTSMSCTGMTFSWSAGSGSYYCVKIWYKSGTIPSTCNQNTSATSFFMSSTALVSSPYLYYPG